MRFPARELFAELCERAQGDIDRIVVLWPIVAEHSRRGGVRFPVGAEGSSHSEGEHSDPTADAVIAALERAPEPEAMMRRAMLRCLDALSRLDQARKAMEAQVPAVAAALADGRDADDGRTMAEIVAIREHRRSVRDDLDCLACNRPTSHRVGGFCDACRMQYVREGRPDRSEFIAARRAFLKAKDERAAEVERLVAERDRWHNDINFTIGPADGVDRRAA